MTPAEFSPQGSIGFRFLGSIHFDEGAFFPTCTGETGGHRSVGHKKTPHSFTTTW